MSNWQTQLSTALAKSDQDWLNQKTPMRLAAINSVANSAGVSPEEVSYYLIKNHRDIMLEMYGTQEVNRIEAGLNAKLQAFAQQQAQAQAQAQAQDYASKEWQRQISNAIDQFEKEWQGADHNEKNPVRQAMLNRVVYNLGGKVTNDQVNLYLLQNHFNIMSEMYGTAAATSKLAELRAKGVSYGGKRNTRAIKKHKSKRNNKKTRRH